MSRSSATRSASAGRGATPGSREEPLLIAGDAGGFVATVPVLDGGGPVGWPAPGWPRSRGAAPAFFDAGDRSSVDRCSRQLCHSPDWPVLAAARHPDRDLVGNSIGTPRSGRTMV